MTEKEKLNLVKDLGLRLLSKHGLYYWSLRFNTSVKSYGRCNHTRKIIFISKKYIVNNTIEDIKNTILHEIAHALLPYHHKHDNVWRNKAIEIGCDGKIYVGENTIRPEKKYKGICNTCNKTIKRHRRIFKLACGNCCQKYNNNKYSNKFVFTWSVNI